MTFAATSFIPFSHFLVTNERNDRRSLNNVAKNINKNISIYMSWQLKICVIVDYTKLIPIRPTVNCHVLIIMSCNR